MSYKNILVTGARGFIGKNLVTHLNALGRWNVLPYGSEDSEEKLVSFLEEADFIFHLAGVNRPKELSEFETVNFGLTKKISQILIEKNKKCPILLSSSTQVLNGSPYGISRKRAEEVLLSHAEVLNSPIYIYRLPNVFGKWCRPNYNSVVATYAYNVSRGIELKVNDPEVNLTVVYIDDVIDSFLTHLSDSQFAEGSDFFSCPKAYEISLGNLAKKFQMFEHQRKTQFIPDFADELTKKLFATYISALPVNQFAQSVDLKCDTRGALFELVKSQHSGQIFVSTTKPGITRGNHFHHTKVEKFCVVQGEAIVRFKHMVTGELLEYPLNSKDIQILDIPPGYTHNITNVGDSELLVLFWSNEIFDPESPDTYFEEV